MTASPTCRSERPNPRAAARAAAVLALIWNQAGAQTAEPDRSDATRRAVEFLVQEVPDWPRQNRCFSCHNNGDGARALLVARRRGWDVPDAALAATTEWLRHPDRWEQNGGNPDYSDRRLITVQFSAALASLADERSDGQPDEATSIALQAAAGALAGLQFPDGSWAFEAEGQIGTPIGYGRPLMTVVARDVLIRADEQRFAAEIARAAAWLRTAEPRTVLDAAAVLGGLAAATDPAAQARVPRLLEIIRRGQSPRGGWGPFEISAPEPFDTAVVLLALQRLPPSDESRRLIAAGRDFLRATQRPAGGWPATTRPAGAESYPQMMSTSAWATLALLLTE